MVSKEQLIDSIIEFDIDKAVNIPDPILCSIYSNILSGSDWMITRHQEETLGNLDTTLTNEQFGNLTANRKKIREIINKLRGT